MPFLAGLKNGESQGIYEVVVIILGTYPENFLLISLMLLLEAVFFLRVVKVMQKMSDTIA